MRIGTRVRAAIRNAGLEFPIERITVNLAPNHADRVRSGDERKHFMSGCLKGEKKS